MMIRTEMTVLLKGGKIRYVPMSPELASELRRFPVVICEDRIFPPKPGATSGKQRSDKSFEDLLTRAKIRDHMGSRYLCPGVTSD